MTTLKDRLLEVLEDTTWSDLPEAALVEVLMEQLKRTKAMLFDEQAAVIKEGVRANDIERTAHEEIRQLRTNPLAGACGDFYFVGINANGAYVVSIDGPRMISMYERTGGIDYRMRQINAEEFARRASGGTKK